MRLGWIFASFSLFLALLHTSHALSIEYIEGQRCLLAPSQTKGASHPPLIVLPGMAQSIAGWEPHVPALSHERDVLIYECLGIGPKVDKKLLDDVSLPIQAERLLQTIETAFPHKSSFHVAGFSLGGRAAMAAACTSSKISKLHLTGVGAARSDWGRLQLQSWKDHLLNNNLRAFGWAALLASYSPAFLMKSQDKLPLWVDGISKSQTVPGLLALLEQTHEEGYDAEWSVESMAKRLSIPAGRLCVGELDQMSPVDQVVRLADLLGWEEPTVVPDVAHVVPSEAARLWRNDLLGFLDGPS